VSQAVGSSQLRQSRLNFNESCQNLFRGGHGIPQFYYPKKTQPTPLSPEQRSKIREFFEKKPLVEKAAELEPVVTQYLGLSRYFCTPIFQKVLSSIGTRNNIDEYQTSCKNGGLGGAPGCGTSTAPETGTSSGEERISSSSTVVGQIQNIGQQEESGAEEKNAEKCSSKQFDCEQFCNWCDANVDVDDPYLTFFFVAKASQDVDFISRNDLRTLIDAVLVEHPGLQFLQSTKEFQEKYSDTVIARIFFVHSHRDDQKISLTDLRRRQVLRYNISY